MKFRVLIALVLTGVSANVFAKSEFLDFFMSHYKISDSSTLGSKACLICHQTEDDYTKMNVYGADLKMEMAAIGYTAFLGAFSKSYAATPDLNVALHVALAAALAGAFAGFGVDQIVYHYVKTTEATK